MLKRIRGFILLFTVLTAYGAAQDSLRVGSQAPDFLLPLATKDTLNMAGVQLSTLMRSGPVLLAFYPADWSGGCTKEMCAMRDNFVHLADLGVSVFGISGDYVYSHREWARYLHLPFGLLSDHDHRVARLYESYNEHTGYNRRTVFVVNSDGLISYIDRRYSVSSDDSFNALKLAIQHMR